MRPPSKARTTGGPRGAPLAWVGRQEHAQAGRPYLPPQASTPTTSPRPRAICALCRLAGTAEPQPLTSGRADCPQEPGPGGDLAGSTRGAPPQPGEAGAAAPRRHLETGAWRAPTRLPGRLPGNPEGFLKPLTSGGRGLGSHLERLVSQRLPPTARPPRWGGIAWIPSGLLSHQAARTAGTSIRGYPCAPLSKGASKLVHQAINAMGARLRE